VETTVVVVVVEVETVRETKLTKKLALATSEASVPVTWTVT
jgi:hypothetical protein